MSHETDRRWQEIEQGILACQRSGYDSTHMDALFDVLYGSGGILSMDDTDVMVCDPNFLKKLVTEYGHDIHLIGLWGMVLTLAIKAGTPLHQHQMYPLVLQLIENWHEMRDKKAVFPDTIGMQGLMHALDHSVDYALSDDVFVQQPSVYDFVIHCLKKPVPGQMKQKFYYRTQEAAIDFLINIRNTSILKHLTDGQIQEITAILSTIDPVQIACRQEDLDLIRESLNQKISNGKKG